MKTTNSGEACLKKMSISMLYRHGDSKVNKSNSKRMLHLGHVTAGGEWEGRVTLGWRYLLLQIVPQI